MTSTSDPRALVDHLRNGQQCDEDGVMCIVSRQACHQAAAALTAALDEIATLRTEKHADAEAIGVLRRENKIFRGALGDIYDGEPEWPNDPQKELDWCRNRARGALKGTGQ